MAALAHCARPCWTRKLWNEPDSDSSAIQHIKPEDYVELVRRVVPVIRDETPETKVVVGSIILPTVQDPSSRKRQR